MGETLAEFHIRDLFHVYLNTFEFHFLLLHINGPGFDKRYLMVNLIKI